MAFRQVSSPHAHGAQNTAKVMQLVVWATIPGLIALTWHFGWGSFINVLLASITAVISEALILKCVVGQWDSTWVITVQW